MTLAGAGIAASIPVNVPVVGVATLVNQAAQGLTIFNNDSVNGVWISENQGVGPGVGWFLGPQGSLTWQVQGSPVYACADTGVTTPVTLTMGNSVTDLTNPIAIATAVAAKLLATGIPNVLITDQVYSGGVPGPTDVEVGSYASLIITASNALHGRSMGLTVTWYADAAHTIQVDYQYISMWPTGVTGTPPFLSVEMPVKAPHVSITINTSAVGSQLNVIGSNRAVATTRMLNPGSFGMIRQLANPSAIAANVLTPLTTADTLADYTTINGKVTVSCFCSVVSTLYMMWLDPTNTQKQAAIGTCAAGANTQFSVGHPLGAITWGIAPGAAMAAGGCALTVWPETVS